MYASSYFYAPTHPTVEDQVELARRISHSLSDVKNMKSKGQTMYVNRKKRSVKWIHDGNGEECEEEFSTLPKEKVPLKCMMNPNGKLLDIHGIQALGEEVNIEPRPLHPEKLFNIVHDLNNQRGRGAEIFAKRRKRSEKWVVDKEQSQSPNNNNGYPRYPAYTGNYQEPSYIDKNTKFPHLASYGTPNREPKGYSNPYVDAYASNVAPAEETNKPIVTHAYTGPKISSYQNLTNYNTAPRGWDQSFSIYKPIKFEKPQEPIAYSDF